MAGPAGATHVASTLTASAKPTIGVGQTNQLAGNLTIAPGGASSFAVGESIVISVDDSDAAANCAAATDFVAFSALPTVTVSGTAAVSTSFTPGACGVARNDQLTILVTGAGTVSQITVSNVRYDVGAAADNGDVKLVLSGTAPTPTLAAAPGDSNAFITRVLLTANTPPLGVRAGSGVQALGNIVVTEQVVDAAGGSVCVRLTSGADTFDTATPLPTVAVTGGTGDTATVASANAGAALQLTVTDAAADTGAATFTISGLRASATTTATTGLVTAILTSGSCAAPVTVANTLSATTTLAAVVDTERFGGSDRFTTAQILFEDAFPCGGGNGLANVLIARGDLFPDALAASYLAGKNTTGILLVDPRTPNDLPAATVNALRNRGVDSVTIIGGETAVPATLATLLDNLPNVNCAGTTEAAPNTTISVSRIGGADRYETARNVAERPGLGAAGTADFDGTASDPDGPACNPRKTAILATGENFPDALVAGVVAYGGVLNPVQPCGDGEGFPLILTTPNALHPQAAAALTNLGIQQVLVMGGNVAIEPAVVTSVQGINSITTRRFAGSTRLDTAKQFAEFAIDFLGYDEDAVSVARGDAFPDALAGAPHAIQNPDVGHAAIVLTESATVAGAETLSFFRERQGVAGVLGRPATLDVIQSVDIYGGPEAVADSTVAAILGAISQG